MLNQLRNPADPARHRRTMLKSAFQQRIGEGFRKGMLLEAIYGALICVVMLVFSEPLMRLFANGSDADLLVEYGGSYLRTMALFYVLPALSNGVQGFFRGMGNARMTLNCTILQTTLRVIFTYLLIPVSGIRGIAFACMIGWVVMILYEIPAGIIALRKWNKIN